MARFPQYKSTGNINTAQTGAVSRGLNLGSVAGLVGEVAEAGVAWKKAENNANSLSEYNRFQQDIAILGSKAAEESDFNKKQEYINELNSLTQKSLSTLPQGEIGLQYAQKIDSERNSANIRLNSGFNAKMIDQSKVDYGLQRESLKDKIINEPDPILRQGLVIDLKSLTESNFETGVISDDYFLRDMQSYEQLDLQRAQNDAFSNPGLFIANSDSYKIDPKEKESLVGSAESIVKKRQLSFEIDELIAKNNNTTELVDAYTNIVSDDGEIAKFTAEMASSGRIDESTGLAMKDVLTSSKTINAEDNARVITRTALLADSLGKSTMTSRQVLKEVAKEKTRLLKRHAAGELTKNTLQRAFATLSSKAIKERSAKGIDTLQTKGEWGAYGYQDAHDDFKAATGSEEQADILLANYHIRTFDGYEELDRSNREQEVQSIINTFQGNAARNIGSKPEVKNFSSVDIAKKASLPKGTIITINGRRAVVE